MQNSPHEHINLDNSPPPLPPTKAPFFTRITIARVGEKEDGSATTFRYFVTIPTTVRSTQLALPCLLRSSRKAAMAGGGGRQATLNGNKA